MERYKMMRKLSCFLAMMVGMGLYSSAFAGPAAHGFGEVLYLEINTADPLPPGPPVKAGDPVEGAKASIHRNESGVTVNIHIDGLNPNHVYTTWFLEFGSPPPVYLTGHIIGKSGVGRFSGHIRVSDGSMPVMDPMGGEFHVIVADHGPLDPSLLPEDIKTDVPPIDPTGALSWPMVIIFAP
jgi:hypothetical protein